MKKSLLQSVWDTVGIVPRLVLFDQRWLPTFGWTTLEEERIAAVLPLVEGHLLDIGCGPNTLVDTYGDGIGVDVHDWGGSGLVVPDTSDLPYEDASFDTVTLLACLNHIPYREAVLREAHRLLRPGGRLIVTMIDPVLGELGHAIWWYAEDRHRGGMVEGEVGGMWNHEIRRIAAAAGFRSVGQRRFVYKLNNLLVFQRD